MRIAPLNQLDLPVSLPFLEPLLSLDRGIDVIMSLEVNETLDSISPGKPGQRVTAMLPGATHKIIRDTDVKRAVRRAGHDVDPGIGHPCAPFSIRNHGWPAFAGHDKKEKWDTRENATRRKCDEKKARQEGKCHPRASGDPCSGRTRSTWLRPRLQPGMSPSCCSRSKSATKAAKRPCSMAARMPCISS